MEAAVAILHDYSHLIGRELTVSYADQNESFAPYLPRSGAVVRQVALDDWGGDWLALRPTEPFNYQIGSFDVSFRGVVISYLLVRSRWVGCPIGEQRTSVFLLLDSDGVIDTKERFRSADFIQACWGVIPPFD